MHKLFFILALFLSCPAVAGKYNAHISKAELDITNGNFPAALHHYELAFATRTYPFAIDLYHAGLCALKSNKNALAIKYCRRLAAKGVGEQFFRQSAYASLQRDPHWEKLLLEARQQREELYRRQGGLICLLDSLVAKDQAVNHAWRAAGMSSETRRIMDLTYDTIGLHLKRLTDSMGFLSEEQTGAYVEKDTCLQQGRFFDIIIIHNYTARMTGDTLFNGTLRRALALEQIKPEHYASLRDFTHGGDSPDDYFGTAQLYVQYQCNLYREKLDSSAVQQIEQNRKRIDLAPLADYEKKLMYNIGHRKGIFNIYAPITIYRSFKNESSEQYFLNGHQLIARNIPDCQ